ncbi:MAG: DUF169 domain-containing protein [Bacteroidales bacterium]
MIDKLMYLYGPKCTAVNVNGEFNDVINVPCKQMTLCEAVNCSFKLPLRIHEGNLSCIGARRSMGFFHDIDKHVQTIAGNNNMPERFVRKALQNIPVLENIRHINLGIQEYSEHEDFVDLYILYVSPAMVTQILYRLAQEGLRAHISPFFFLSVCGNVLANTYSRQVTSISFGCPDSRVCGGIESHEVVVGIPNKVAKRLVAKL